MYWLLPQNEQNDLRRLITDLTRDLALLKERDQSDQVFPFNGRKDRRVAQTILNYLAPSEQSIICDPFSGSGVFSYAALDGNRQILMNEWEPYAFRLSTAPFRPALSQSQLESGLATLDRIIGQDMRWLYQTRCANCGSEHVMDGLFYDREPAEYFHPMPHDRMGSNGENVIFRGKYKCSCGAKQKHFDQSDLNHLRNVEGHPVIFPNNPLIENSRINFTS